MFDAVFHQIIINMRLNVYKHLQMVCSYADNAKRMHTDGKQTLNLNYFVDIKYKSI